MQAAQSLRRDAATYSRRLLSGTLPPPPVSRDSGGTTTRYLSAREFGVGLPILSSGSAHAGTRLFTGPELQGESSACTRAALSARPVPLKRLRHPAALGRRKKRPRRVSPVGWPGQGPGRLPVPVPGCQSRERTFRRGFSYEQCGFGGKMRLCRATGARSHRTDGKSRVRCPSARVSDPLSASRCW